MSKNTKVDKYFSPNEKKILSQLWIKYKYPQRYSGYLLPALDLLTKMQNIDILKQ